METYQTKCKKDLSSNFKSHFELEGHVINDRQKICEALNLHFTKVGEHLNRERLEPPLQFQMQNIVPDNPVSLHTVAPKEVISAVKMLKNKTSAGLDGISSKVIKSCMYAISQPLANIVSASFRQGQFPRALKSTITIPVHKGGDGNTLDSYRPISQISTFSKVFELIFLGRLNSFLSSNDILSKKQFGFTKGKSSGEALSFFISDIVTDLDQGRRAVGVMMDLTKAFDCVSHPHLLEYLRFLGLGPLALQWLSSYLSQREQCVQVEGSRSLWAPVNYGVPQGSILGPVLYNLYVNNLPQAVPHNQLVMYADDIALSFSSGTIEELEIHSHVALTQLYQFLNNLNLHLNLKKTTFLEFSKRAKENSPHILINNSVVQQNECVKYLGVQIDDDLSWRSHINHVCQSLSSTVFLMSQLAKYRNKFLLKLVYCSLIESRLRYGLLVWGSATLAQMKRVFVLQKRAVRVLAGLKRRESCKTAFKELNLLTLPSLYIFETIIFAKFNSVAVTDGYAVHEHNTRARVNLRQTQHQTASAARLPHNVGARGFWRLPEPLKCIQNKQEFKRKLKEHLVEGCFYAVGEFFEQ